MNTSIFILVTTLAGFTCAEDATQPTVEQAHQTYEETIKAADDQLQKSLSPAMDEYLKQLRVAQDESLKQLRNDLDAAMKAKDLKKANDIDMAIKSMTKTKESVALDSKNPLGIKARQTYDETAMAAIEEHRLVQEVARSKCQRQLQALLDAALSAKDLEEANRIDTVMKTVSANRAPTVVYLLDRSVGMAREGRLKVAQSQLKASLNSLHPNQKFAVVSYARKSRESLKLSSLLDDQFLYFATDVNKELAGRELDRMTATIGAPAPPPLTLIEGITPRPEVLYLLTNGLNEEQYKPLDVAQIRRLSKTVTIHVIKIGDSFLPRQRPSWLEKLASQFNGEYREVRTGNPR